MVVLSLQLHGVLVAAADLRVALQEHFLVVADPVEHLHTRGKRQRVARSGLGAESVGDKWKPSADRQQSDGLKQL